LLNKVLKSMGYEGLSRLCNPSVMGIINEFEASPDPTKLAELILEIYGPASLLQDSQNRKLILEYLTEDSAYALCDAITLKPGDNPWKKLMAARFATERKKALFDFFGVELPEDFGEEIIAQRKFCEVIEGDYSLFPHQERAANQIKNYLGGTRERVLLHMPTGAGKTRTAMSIACDYIRNAMADRKKSFVVWLADTEELCDQAASEFERAWKTLGIGSTNLYRLHGDVVGGLGDLSHGFVVTGLQKLNSISSKEQSSYYDFCSNTTLVIFDEAHKAIASTYKHSVDVFQAVGKANLLGLSATPGRSTFDREQNIEFADFFHMNKVSLEVQGYKSPIEYLQSEGYLAQVKYHDIPYEEHDLSLSPQELQVLQSGDEPSDGLLQRLGLDQKRNIKILYLALELVKSERSIILFAPSVESAEGIFALLRYKDVKAGLVTGSTESGLRRKTIERYKAGELRILVNFGVLTTGFDAPVTSVAIIARPTNSLTLFSQMVGRATRGTEAKGNAQADVYVIKDTLPGLRDMTSAFSHWDDTWGIEE
jgi:DNA repair protein RadD